MNSAPFVSHSAKAEPGSSPKQVTGHLAIATTAMGEKSRVLIIGGTGYIGKYLVDASAKAGHPTSILLRDATLSDPAKAHLIESFKTLKVQILQGDLHNQESLVKAIKQVDVVISAAGIPQLADQANIIAAIQEAGCVKKFYPSEFGPDCDRIDAVEPAAAVMASKAAIRRKIEALGIPYTYICCNGFAGYFTCGLLQVGATSPPRDKFIIFGDGNTKVVSNKEEDIATYTVRTFDDPRTLNKSLYVRPPKNIVSSCDLVAMWEKKIGKTFEKTYLPEDQILKQIEEAPHPRNWVLAIYHAIIVRGAHTSFQIDSSFGFEASELYPDVAYTSVDEYLDLLV